MKAILLSILVVSTSCLPFDLRQTSGLWSSTEKEHREYQPVETTHLPRQKRIVPMLENLLMGLLGGKAGMNNGGNYGYPNNGHMPNLYGNYGIPSFGNGNYGPGYGNGYYGPPNGYYGPANGYYGPNTPNGSYGPGIPNGYPGPGIPNGYPSPGIPNGYPGPGIPNGFPGLGAPNGFPGASNPNGFAGGSTGCSRRRYG